MGLDISPWYERGNLFMKPEQRMSGSGSFFLCFQEKIPVMAPLCSHGIGTFETVNGQFKQMCT
jgi:hypothetical protein